MWFDVVRLFLLAHYRTKVSFSQKKLDECKKMIEKLKDLQKTSILIEKY